MSLKTLSVIVLMGSVLAVPALSRAQNAPDVEQSGQQEGAFGDQSTVDVAGPGETGESATEAATEAASESAAETAGETTSEVESPTG